MTVVDITPQDWVQRLAARAEDADPDIRKYNRHYDLEQPLSYMHPELWLEVSERIKPLLVAWPQVVVDSVEERLDVEGFRFDTQAKNDNRLWDWWQANNLDEGAQQEHLEALICGRGFVIVGAGDDPETPRITVESARQVYADFDPQTRKVRAALKQWVDGKQQFATLYLPNETIYFQRDGNGALEEYDRDVHGIGVPLVVPFANRGRVLRLNPDGGLRPPGVSELAPIIPLSDAACKIGTDMMVAAETVAIPSRYVFGVSQDEFVDPDGNPVSKWKQVLGKMMAHEDPDIKAGQWPSASLDNFHKTLNELARMVAAIAALPPHYLGFTTDNPASADAIRSNEARLVKRAERKQTSFGESWEQVMNLAIRVVDGEWDPDARRLETRWRDAATPTIAMTTDAAIKKFAAGVVPLRQTREDLGYTEAQIDNMEQADALETQPSPALNDVLRPQQPAVTADAGRVPQA